MNISKLFFALPLAALAACSQPTPISQQTETEQPELFSAGSFQFYNDMGSVEVVPVYRGADPSEANPSLERAVLYRAEKMEELEAMGYNVSRMHIMQDPELRIWQCHVIVVFDGDLPAYTKRTTCTQGGRAHDFYDTVDLKWSRMYISDSADERASFYEAFVYDRE